MGPTKLGSAALALIVLFMSPATADTGVVGDDESDSYVGAGSLLLARTWTGTSRDRAVIARCQGCRWVVVRSCRSDHAVCHWEQLPACPATTVRFDVSFATSATSPLRFRGTTCIGPGGPPTQKRVHERVDQQTRQRLPALTPRMLSAIAVAGTSSRFTSGAPTATVFDLRVLGQPVRITAAATVTWRWADGVTMRTNVPTVSRSWTHSGKIRATTTAVWVASYTVDDLGPFPVAQAIHQDGFLVVPVLRARPVLVPMP